MKTCSFRGALPRSLDEGLFCKSHLPAVLYALQPCDQMSCSLCETPSTTVHFNSYRAHRFVNHYYAILNCPANCQTQNIMYALTCPCGNYDFIGSTTSNITEVIQCIREKGNHFIHNLLLAATSFHNALYDTNHFLSN
ncbi:unnamed protein product [Rotaria sp. Silwood1]|nr:unnamed protein product [Rotaria sp. Silwood1]